MRTYPPPQLNIGDKVAYSVQFLKSIGMSHSDMAHARGIVTAITVRRYDFGTLHPAEVLYTLVTINWQGADMPSVVNVCNLAKVGSNPRFCNVD